MTGARSWLRVDAVPVDREGVVLLDVAGELDLATIAALLTAVGIRLAKDKRIVLNLEGVDFCDSTGLGALIKLHHHALDVGGALALCAPPSRVVDVLRVSGVDQVVAVYPTVASAMPPLRSHD